MKKIITAAFAFLLVLPLMACGNNGTKTKTITVANAMSTVENSITTIIDGAKLIDQTDEQAIQEFVSTQFNGGLTANVSLKMNGASALQLTMAAEFGEGFLANGASGYLHANVEGNEMSIFMKPTAPVEPSYSYVNIKKANYNAKIKMDELSYLFGEKNPGEPNLPNPPSENEPSENLERMLSAPAIATNILATAATSSETDEVLAMLEQIKIMIADPQTGNSAKKVTYKNGNYDIVITINNYFVGSFIAGLMLAQDPTMTEVEIMALAQTIGDAIKQFDITFNYNKSNNIQGVAFGFKAETKVMNVTQSVEAAISVKFGATIPQMSEELTNAELISSTNEEQTNDFKSAFHDSVKDTFIGNLIIK